MKTLTTADAERLLEEADAHEDVLVAADKEVTRVRDDATMAYVENQGPDEDPARYTEAWARLFAAAPALARAMIGAERERDAYKRAKQENDDRFMRERDDARRERDEAKALVAELGDALHQLRCDVEELTKERDDLADRCNDLHYAQSRWHHNAMFLARAVRDARREMTDIAMFMLDDSNSGPDVGPGKENEAEALLEAARKAEEVLDA